MYQYQYPGQAQPMPMPYYVPQPMDQLAALRAQQMPPMAAGQAVPPQGMVQQAPAGASDSGIIWVQGEAGAKAYMVAPGSTVALWDSEAQSIYLKSVDASGMPSMRTLDYTERGAIAAQAAVAAPEPIDLSQYVKRDEVEQMVAERVRKILNKRLREEDE